jgi:hypothetical protein
VGSQDTSPVPRATPVGTAYVDDYGPTASASTTIPTSMHSYAPMNDTFMTPEIYTGAYTHDNSHLYAATYPVAPSASHIGYAQDNVARLGTSPSWGTPLPILANLQFGSGGDGVPPAFPVHQQAAFPNTSSYAYPVHSPFPERREVIRTEQLFGTTVVQVMQLNHRGEHILAFVFGVSRDAQ